MKIIKCDICKKTIHQGADSYTLSCDLRPKFSHFEICADCGKPLAKFTKDKKLIKIKNKKDEK